MIALVDMDAFFSSVEQMDNPRLQGCPVGVVNGEQGSTIIAASYEARALGIRTGTSWADARARCPEFVRVVSRPARYSEISNRIMTALQEVTPELEIFSVDEAFLDLTSCQAYYRYQPETIGHLIRATVLKASGLSCSVGISGDKTTAKWAAKQEKPGGLTLVHPDEAEQRLANIPLTELCGIGPGIAEFFAQYDVYRCGDMKRIPISVPAQRFGNLGRRLWLMAQGRDPAAIDQRAHEPKSLSHGKILPPQVREVTIIHGFFMHMAEKLATRLRRHGYVVQEYHISMRCPEGWRQAWMRTEQGTSDGAEIFRLCKRFLRQHWFGEVVQQIRIHAASPVPSGMQPDFFALPGDDSVNQAMDDVNGQFGAFAVHRGSMHSHARSTPVISPAWSRNGMREGHNAVTPADTSKNSRKKN